MKFFGSFTELPYSATSCLLIVSTKQHIYHMLTSHLPHSSYLERFCLHVSGLPTSLIQTVALHDILIRYLDEPYP